MKVVIADTSPINYLILVGAVETLPRLYRRVTIPDVVLSELACDDAPAEVGAWAATPPAWVDVQPVLLSEDPLLEALDAGEHAAILLAQKQTDVLLLMDDASGRAEAARRGVPTIGTLGVLRAASLQGIIALPAVLVRLKATNFRVPEDLINELVAEDKRSRKLPGDEE